MQQVTHILEHMAIVVDKQNSHDPDYIAMSPNTGNSLAFKAAKDLVFLGAKQPNGYTEPLLHHYRIDAKKAFTPSV